MKVREAIALMKEYGAKTTLEEVVKIVQGNRIHKCPKCGGTGTVTKRKNTAQYWECCENWKYYETTCDLCNGEGYTEHEYKPKMIQDGWE